MAEPVPRSEEAFVRRPAKVLLSVGALLIVLGIVAAFVLPAVAVKYPGGPLNKTAHATGSFTLYIDPATAATLKTPQKLALDIKRNLHVTDTSGNRALVEENDIEQIGSLKAQDLQQHYVLNRKTLKNVDDDRSWAYTSDNRVNRSLAYAINLPFGAGKGPYQVWKNETGSSYPFTKTGTTTVAGVKLNRYHGSMTAEPARTYYIAQLVSQGIPKELTPAQVATQLKVLGADPAVLEAAVFPQLAAADRSAAAGLLSANVPLKYTIDVDTTFLVEPKTGAIVGLDRINQTLKATPDIQGIGRIQTILSKPQYVKNAVVQSAATIIGKLVKTPPVIKIFNIDYSQAKDAPYVGSEADLATFVKGRADKITLAEVTLPLSIGGAGVLVALIGLGLRLRNRNTAKSAAAV
jgi:hypothetical protein